MLELNQLQEKLLNNFQKQFPISPTPYADIADSLGITEAEVLKTLSELQANGIISRIGPVFQPHSLGTSTLATMAVPQLKLEKIANYISSLQEVNHNYERDHHFNLWFVITTTTEENLQTILTNIEQNTGFKILSLPMLVGYHIDLGFKLTV
ncbi:MAG: Lrp/AsnC family transcriptional regulator [Proteobacteria bacterium]|nr:Lrp/AsnC family transcriptional regulator [Pseudomonadota bacterium]